MSACWYNYIGISHERAYLEYGNYIFTSANRPHVVIYWTPLSELQTNLVQELKDGHPPWTNWMDKSEQR